MHDVVIRGGTLVDGTGAPGRRADVGVDDGRVVALGAGVGDGRTVLDAEGLTVAPGFIDIHTHYDAQVHWDPLLTPSSLHGVTTVIGGNCGFTVAPIDADSAEYVARLLARVEGIPLEAIQAGMSWDWRGFGNWLERVEGASSLNVGFLVGHSTVRRLVMGEAAAEIAATSRQIQRMSEVVDDALAAGALGFSSSWTEAHTDGYGDPVPSRAASQEELVAVAAVVGQHPGTTLEFVPGLGTFGRRETQAMIEMSLAADRPLNWNLIRVDEPDATTAHERLEASVRGAAQDAAIVALVHPEPTQVRVSLAVGTLYENLPGWDGVMNLPLRDRHRVLDDPDRRRELLHRVSGRELKWPLSILARWGDLTIAETFEPRNSGLEGRTVGEVAAERGSDAFDTMLDVASVDGLRTYFALPRRGTDDATWQKRLEMWRHPWTIVGGSDAGAHLDLMCGATYTTSLLGEAVRDQGLLSLEEAVQLLTDAPARLYGLEDRGRIGVGAHADLVIFDRDRIGPGLSETRTDLPGGAARLFAPAEGIEHVLVNGREILRRGTPTGDRPGQLLRSGHATATVSARAWAATRRDR